MSLEGLENDLHAKRRTLARAELALQTTKESTLAELYSDDEPELEPMRRRLAALELRLEEQRQDLALRFPRGSRSTQTDLTSLLAKYDDPYQPIQGSRPEPAEKIKNDIHSLERKIVKLTREIHTLIDEKLQVALKTTQDAVIAAKVKVESAQQRLELERQRLRELQEAKSVARAKHEAARRAREAEEQREAERQRREAAARAEKGMIQQSATQRGVKALVHFTRTSNLASILKRGILPRATLDANHIPYEFNDHYRTDRRLDCSCFSVMFANYRMFYAYQCQSHQEEWCILIVDASLLWEGNCLFCSANASSPEAMSAACELGHTCAAFDAMFAEEHCYKGRVVHRRDLSIPDHYTTNPQAEVLIQGMVSCDRILWALFPSDRAKTKAIGHVVIPRHCHLAIHPKMFRYRSDYQHWRSAGEVNNG